MLERWIVKHWIALSAGCLLMAAAVRMAYLYTQILSLNLVKPFVSQFVPDIVGGKAGANEHISLSFLLILF